MTGDRGLIIQAVLPSVVALFVLAWILGRVARSLAAGMGPQARQAFLGAYVGGVTVGILVGAVVAAVGYVRGWPWWGMAAAGLGAELVVALLVWTIAFRRSRPPTATTAPGSADADQRERAELRAALTRELDRGGPLMAYAWLRMLLPDFAEYRFGRAIAAEITGLVREGAITVDPADAYGPETVAVRLAPDRPEVRHPEQRYLRRALGVPGDRVVLAATRSAVGDTRWDPLADALRDEFSRRSSPGATAALMRLRRLMRRHVSRAVRDFDQDPELYRLGLPYAILFGQYGRDPDWPWPPEGDPAWVPPALIQACILATTYPGQEHPENLS